MSPELPRDWSHVALGDLISSLDAGVSVNSDGRPCGVGEIGVLKTSCVGGGRFNPAEHKAVVNGERGRVRVPVRGDAIILSRMNTPDLVGENAYVEVDHPNLFLPDRLWLLKTSDRADCRWLSCFMQSQFFRRQLNDIATGTSGSMKNISKARLAELSLSLPPLEEQRRIAEVLRSMDVAITRSEAAEAQSLHVLKQTMVRTLHVEEDTPTGTGWHTARIGELGKVQAGRQRAPSFTQGQLRPYLRVANVFDGYINIGDVLSMAFTPREYEEYRLLPGDILLNEGQSIELVGRAAMYLGEPEDCCFQNTLVRFRAAKVPADFAYALVRTLYWTGRLSAIASRTTSVAHLGVARFANIKVAVPPVPEQHSIGELFNDLCAAHSNLRATSERLRATRRLISTDLLSGRVRVPV